MKNYFLRYIKQPKLFFSDRQKDVRVSLSANARGGEFEGKNKIYSRACVCGSSLGRGSYVGPDSRLPCCKVGRYCSIGPEVLVLAGKHPSSERLSTHPCFYSLRKQSGFTYINQQNFDEFNFVDERKLYYAEIGSDVWIGARVVLVGGVRIGHGAIIATGSVVTKDVEDYAVVAGVPAKHIRYRFHEERRCALLKDPWWDKSEDWICENLGQFTREL